MVLERRRAGRLGSTGALRDAVHAALGRSRTGGIDAATRAFQALRMLVNRELEALEALLGALAGLLRPGGRAVFLSFHSGEDRLVKHVLRDLARRTEPPRLRLLTRRAERPSAAEEAANPRSRSAKLRAIERLAEVA